MTVLDMQEHLNRKEQKEALTFIKLLSELSQVELFGVAHILMIPVYNNVPQEDKIDHASARPLEEIVPEILDSFLNLERAQRRVLIKLLQGKV